MAAATRGAESPVEGGVGAAIAIAKKPCHSKQKGTQFTRIKSSFAPYMPCRSSRIKLISLAESDNHIHVFTLPMSEHD